MKTNQHTTKGGLPLAVTSLFALEEWIKRHPKLQITFYPWGKRAVHSRTFEASKITISRKRLLVCCPGQLFIDLDIASLDDGPKGLTAIDSWGDIVVEANYELAD